ncbi:MAG: 3-deoxy-7-phosphoheptulonate synthase [Elusimicrobia bacterium]|nr:3-deoxy-7-phosphoheptulonate synthase [Elusimicrobiota bacterium]
MIIRFQNNLKDKQKREIKISLSKLLKKAAITIHGSYLIIENENKEQLSGILARVEAIEGIELAKLSNEETYPLINKRKASIIKFKNKIFNDKNFLLIAGPCAIDGRAAYLKTIKNLEKAGADILRAPLFKPRMSPHSFQGIGTEGLKILIEARNTTSLPFITEITDPRQMDLLYLSTDVFQIGARNMRNYELLKAVGSEQKAVLLKRAAGASLKEWLLAAEYIMSCGNNKIILCERGDYSSGNSEGGINFNMALRAIAISKFPLIIDISHSTTAKNFILPLAKASAAIGANGLMVEASLKPHLAPIDGKHTIDISYFKKLSAEIKKLRK